MVTNKTDQEEIFNEGIKETKEELKARRQSIVDDWQTKETVRTRLASAILRDKEKEFAEQAKSVPVWTNIVRQDNRTLVQEMMNADLNKHLDPIEEAWIKERDEIEATYIPETEMILIKNETDKEKLLPFLQPHISKVIKFYPESMMTGRGERFRLSAMAVVEAIRHISKIIDWRKQQFLDGNKIITKEEIDGLADRMEALGKKAYDQMMYQYSVDDHYDAALDAHIAARNIIIDERAEAMRAKHINFIRELDEQIMEEEHKHDEQVRKENESKEAILSKLRKATKFNKDLLTEMLKAGGFDK